MPNRLYSIAPAGIRVAAIALAAFVAGCGSTPKWNATGKAPTAASTPSGSMIRRGGGGGYYLDDGPGDNPPADLYSIPDAIPRDEPLRAANMRPYVALGKSYTPKTSHESYRERGVASWYGRRYHGQKTASGEVYDMYGMTAAHTTLPLPSYVRVTNMANGKSVILRVNDRGPFLSDRLIDLSYTAAYKLDVLDGGSAWVEVESILPGSASAVQVAAASSAEPQNTAAKPDLFEVVSAPVASATIAGASVSSAADAPAAADTSGIYLQLGAFSAYDNADNFLARMRAGFPALFNNLGIVAKDGLFKVHAGPYPDQTVARQAAEKIAQSLSIKPMLLVR
ncbi:MAG TPA: septal ring lytic transglycosylase RlpA family protein [Nitrosospira sp.]